MVNNTGQQKLNFTVLITPSTSQGLESRQYLVQTKDNHLYRLHRLCLSQLPGDLITFYKSKGTPVINTKIPPFPGISSNRSCSLLGNYSRSVVIIRWHMIYVSYTETLSDHSLPYASNLTSHTSVGTHTIITSNTQSCFDTIDVPLENYKRSGRSPLPSPPFRSPVTCKFILLNSFIS